MEEVGNRVGEKVAKELQSASDRTTEKLDAVRQEVIQKLDALGEKMEIDTLPDDAAELRAMMAKCKAKLIIQERKEQDEKDTVKAKNRAMKELEKDKEFQAMKKKVDAYDAIRKGDVDYQVNGTNIFQSMSSSSSSAAFDPAVTTVVIEELDEE